MADKLPFGVGGPAEDTVDPSPLVGSLAMGVLNIPKHLIDSSANAVPGLRKEDVTDNPYAQEPNQPLYNASMDTARALAGSGAPAAEAGAAGIFGGKLARTADIERLIEANKMAKAGESQNRIWGDTGWFKPPTDNKWKFEIPDNNSRMIGHGLDYSQDGNTVAGPTAAMFQHDALYKAYPDLQAPKMWNSSLANPPNGVGKGSFQPMDKSIEVEAPNLGNARQVALHELQHGVQNIENFAPGGNPSYLAGLQQNLPEKLPLHEQHTDPQNLYWRQGGEVESRNVENRMNWDELHRQMVPPWESHDTKFRDQLVWNPKYNFVRALKNTQ